MPESTTHVSLKHVNTTTCRGAGIWTGPILCHTILYDFDVSMG